MPNPGFSGPDDPRLQGLVEAFNAHNGIYRHAAQALGLDEMTFRRRLQALKLFEAAPEGQREAVQTTKLDFNTASHGWIKTDGEGNVTGHSVFWKNRQAPEDVAEQIRAALESMQPAAVVPPPLYSDDDLLTIYPIADAHFGMQAWGRETGEDYDTAKASERLRAWIGRCIASSPASSQAIILGVGDMLHANDHSNQTPQSHHGLDVDTRFYKTMAVACEALGTAVEAALAKHASVTVVILPGNHDRDSYIGLRLGLYYRFRDNPRVSIFHEPGEFYVQQFGNALITAHHGDKAKAQQMVLYLADQYAEQWGKTKHRFLWTGHLHHHKSQDIGGVQWEQLRAMTPRDAYATSHAYVARAQLQAITLHRTDGEVQRVKVNG